MADKPNPYDKHPGKYALGTDEVFRDRISNGTDLIAVDYPAEPFPFGTVVITHGITGTVYQRLRSTGLYHPVTGGSTLTYEELQAKPNVVLLMMGRDA